MPAAFPSWGDESRVGLLEVDPLSVLAYWKAGTEALRAGRRRLDDPKARVVIRFREASLSDPESTVREFELPVPGPQGSRFVNLERPFRVLRSELGLRSREGEFLTLARSNLARTPRHQESERYEERFRRIAGGPSPVWRSRAPALREPRGLEGAPAAEVVVELEPGGLEPSPGPLGSPPPPRPGNESIFPDVARRLAPDSPGDRSRPAGEVPGWPAFEGALASTSQAARDRMQAGAGSRDRPPPSEKGGALKAGGKETTIGISSPGGGFGRSGASLSGQASLSPAGEETTLELCAELVIYGRARAGTVLRVAGRQVPVRSDGTFEVRFALPLVPPGDRTGPAMPGAPPDGT